MGEIGAHDVSERGGARQQQNARDQHAAMAAGRAVTLVRPPGGRRFSCLTLADLAASLRAPSYPAGLVPFAAK